MQSRAYSGPHLFLPKGNATMPCAHPLQERRVAREGRDLHPPIPATALKQRRDGPSAMLEEVGTRPYHT